MLQITQHTSNLCSTFKQGHPKTAWLSHVFLVEMLTDRQIPQVDAYSRRVRPWSKIGPVKDMSIFDTEGCAGMDVKVLRTENPEKLVWVNACTNEVKNCPQIAAINTVTLKESPDNEASASSGQPAARDITLKAKKDLDQEPQPLKRRIWSTVPCSRKSSM